jgi:hypothetical protein
VVKRRHGLNRCRYKGDAGMKRWVGLGVIADNSAAPLLSLQRAERMPEHKGPRPLWQPAFRCRVYIAAMLAQQVIALQTELHRPKPL